MGYVFSGFGGGTFGPDFIGILEDPSKFPFVGCLILGLNHIRMLPNNCLALHFVGNFGSTTSLEIILFASIQSYKPKFVGVNKCAIVIIYFRAPCFQNQTNKKAPYVEVIFASSG
jgi:hypothetical protein